MTNNMTIGPALAIGGNKVEMTQQGKIQVTNSQGKVKTLSQDEFKKQLIKNANNIEAGKDFEFKKDNKNAKVAAGIGTALAAAYVGLSVAVGKGKLTKAVAEQGKKLGFVDQAKNLFFAIGDSGVKLWKNITGKANKLADKIKGKKNSNVQNQNRTIFNGERTENANLDNLDARLTSKETLKLKRDTSVNMAKNQIEYVENIKKQSYSDLVAKEEDLNRVFENYDPIKFKKSKALENVDLNEKQYKVIKEYAYSPEGTILTKEQKEILPNWIQDKESCQRYTNMIEAKFAKIDEQFATK